jgi:hypothetical protein
MERTTQEQGLELRASEMQLNGVKLVVGREYPTGNGNLKCKYLGLIQSRYNGLYSRDTPVHRFVIGKIKDKEVRAIAQVDILAENLQTSPDGTVISNSETKYPTRYYFPEPDHEIKGVLPTFDELIKFVIYAQFLKEESK